MSRSKMAAVRFNNEASRFLTAAKTGDAQTVLSMLKYGPITNANMRTRGRGVDGVVSGSHTQKEYYYEEEVVEEALRELTSEANEASQKGGNPELEVRTARKPSTARRVCREREVTVLYDDDIGFTPLMLAAKYGHVEVVTALLMRNNDLQIEHDEKMNAEWLRWWRETYGQKRGCSCASTAQKQNDCQTSPTPHAYKPMHPNVAAMKFVDVNATAANLVPSAFRVKEVQKSRYYFERTDADEAEAISSSSLAAEDAPSSLDPTLVLRGEDFFLTPLALAVRYHRLKVVAALLKLCCGLNTETADAAISSCPTQKVGVSLYDFSFTLPPPPLPFPPPNPSPSAAQSGETETNTNTKGACDCGASSSVHQMLSLPLVVLPLGPLDMGNISTGGVEGNFESIVNFAIRAGVEERKKREAEAERQGAFRPALSALFSSSFFLEDDDGNAQIENGGSYPPQPPSIGVPNERNDGNLSADTDRCFFGNKELFNFDETEIVRLLSQAIAVGIRNRFVRDSFRLEDPNIWPLCDVILVADSLSRSTTVSHRVREELDSIRVLTPSFYYPPAAAYTKQMHNKGKEAPYHNGGGNNSNSDGSGEWWCVWHPLPLFPFYAETAGRGRRNGHLQRLSGLAYHGAALNAVADLLYRKTGEGASMETVGGTPLHLAVALESAPIVKLLLSVALDDIAFEVEEKKSDETRRASTGSNSTSDSDDDEGEDNFTASNRFLLCDPFAVDEEEETAFHRACSQNSVSVIKVFLAFSQQMRRWVEDEETFYAAEEECEEDEDQDHRRRGDAPKPCPPHLMNIVFIAGGGTIRSNIITQRSPLVGSTALHFAASASRGTCFGLRGLCTLVDSEMALGRMRVPLSANGCASTTDKDAKGACRSSRPQDVFAPAAPFFKELLDAFEGRKTSSLGACSTCVVTMGSSSIGPQCSTNRTFSFLPSQPMIADGFPLIFSAMVSYLLWAFGRSAEGKETLALIRSTSSSSCANVKKGLKNACFEDSLASSGPRFRFHEGAASRSRDSLWWCPDKEEETDDGVVGCALNDELRQVRRLLLSEFEEEKGTEAESQQQGQFSLLLKIAFHVVASQLTFTGTTVLTSICAAFEAPSFWSLDLDDITDVPDSENNNEEIHKTSDEVATSESLQQHQPSPRGEPSDAQMNFFCSRNQLLQQIAFGLTCGTLTQKSGLDEDCKIYSYTEYPAPTCLFTAGPADSRIVRSLALLSEMLRSLSPNTGTGTTRVVNAKIDKTNECYPEVESAFVSLDEADKNEVLYCVFEDPKRTCDKQPPSAVFASQAVGCRRSARRVRSIGGGDAAALDMEGETPLMLLLSSVGSALRGGNAGPPWMAPSEEEEEERIEGQNELDFAHEEALATENTVKVSRALRRRKFECFPAVYAAEMLLVAGDVQLSSSASRKRTSRILEEKEEEKTVTKLMATTRRYVDLVSERHEWTSLHHFVREGLGYAYSSADLGERIENAVAYLNQKREEQENTQRVALHYEGDRDLRGEANLLGGSRREDDEKGRNSSSETNKPEEKDLFTYKTAAQDGVFDGYLEHIIFSFLACEHTSAFDRTTTVPTSSCNHDHEAKQSEDLPNSSKLSDGRQLLRTCCLPTAASVPDVELYRIQYAVSLCELLLHRHSASVTPFPTTTSTNTSQHDVDEEDHKDTALHLLARASESIPSLLVAKALFDVGVDVNALDEEGCTALDLAIESRNHLFARLLVSEGGERTEKSSTM